MLIARALIVAPAAVAASRFSPPLGEGLPMRDRLTRHFLPQAQGVTLLVVGGIWQEHAAPTSDEIAAADTVYYGGHDYTLTAAEVAAITAAGYGAGIT